MKFGFFKVSLATNVRGNRRSGKSRLLFDSLRNNAEAFYLYDPAGPTSDEPQGLTKAFTVVTSSPNREDVYTQFARNPGISKVYLPCYELEEMKVVMANDDNEHFTTKEMFVDGIPRSYCYDGPSIFSMINTAMESVPFRDYVVGMNSAEFVGRTDTKQSHLLFKYDVDPNSFQKRGMKFVTPLIGRRFQHIKYQREFIGVRANILFNNADRSWNLFQSVVIDFILKVGGSYQLSNISKPKSRKLVIEIPENIKTVTSLEMLVETSAFCPGDYQPVGDLILMLENSLVYVNATLAISHQVSIKIDEYKKFAAKRGKKLILAWAIPEYHEKKFRPPHLEDMTQVLLLIPMDKEDEKWKVWMQSVDKEWDAIVTELLKLKKSSTLLLSEKDTNSSLNL